MARIARDYGNTLAELRKLQEGLVTSFRRRIPHLAPKGAAAIKLKALSAAIEGVRPIVLPGIMRPRAR